MKRINRTTKLVILGTAGVLIIIFALLAIRHTLNNHETPDHQLSRLATTTRNLTGQLLSGHNYSLKTSERRCINEGKDEWLGGGRDTIHCFNTVQIQTDLKGKGLRDQIERLGGWRGLYNDGSGSDYTFGYEGARCSALDGKTYRTREEAENNFMDGYLIIDCQNFTDQYNSPLPAPESPAD